MKYSIETYGCQMNVYDSRQMEWLLQNAGHEPASEVDEADLLLLNTCAIRESAEQRIWGQLGRYKQWKNRRKGRILALCGCMAQNHGEGIFKRVPYVDLVLGSGALASLPGFVDDLRRGSSRRIDLDFHEDSFLYFGCPGGMGLPVRVVTAVSSIRFSFPSCAAAITGVPIASCPGFGAGSFIAPRTR
jgi:tRNA-2-methylthio-N6-dimethylallyladenosine synthase